MNINFVSDNGVEISLEIDEDTRVFQVVDVLTRALCKPKASVRFVENDEKISCMEPFTELGYGDGDTVRFELVEDQELLKFIRTDGGDVPIPENISEIRQSLMEIGFCEEDIDQALEYSNFSPDIAANILYEHEANGTPIPKRKLPEKAESSEPKITMSAENQAVLKELIEDLKNVPDLSKEEIAQAFIFLDYNRDKTYSMFVNQNAEE